MGVAPCLSATGLRLVLAGALVISAPGCGWLVDFFQDEDTNDRDEVVVPPGSIPVVVAVPLTPEQAAALAGVSQTDDLSRTDDLVMDVLVNDQSAADAVRGGVRAGVRGGVRAGVRAGIRASAQRQAGSDGEAISFEAQVAIPNDMVREGENSLVARIRPVDSPDAHLFQVKTKVGSAGGEEGATPEVQEKNLAPEEVEFPDADRDGVSTLLEAVSLGVSAALDGGVKPTEDEVRAAIEKFAAKLIEEMKRQGLIVSVDPSKIDFTPPVGGLAFAEGDVPASRLPGCESDKITPATDSVETFETAATLVLCANEPARFQCSLDGAPPAPCLPPLSVGGLEFGRHSIAVVTADGNGNTQEKKLTFRWQVVPKSLPAPTGLAATAGEGGVTLRWDTVAGATGYKVYYGTSAEALVCALRSTEPSTSVGGLQNGTTYSFAVVALAGEKESEKSAIVSASPFAGGQAILSPPSGLVATAGNGEVTLAWAAANGSTGYKVYYGTSADQLTSTLTASDTTIIVGGLTNGTAYYFAVGSVGSSGAESAKSEAVKATPAAVVVPVGSSFCVLDSSAVDACTLG